MYLVGWKESCLTKERVLRSHRMTVMSADPDTNTLRDDDYVGNKEVANKFKAKWKKIIIWECVLRHMY